MKTTGATGVTLLTGMGSVAAEVSIGDGLDADGGLQEALIVFTSTDPVDRLRHLDLESGYHRFEVLPIGYTELTGDQIETVADWPEVRYVQANAELEYYNDETRNWRYVDPLSSSEGTTWEEAGMVDSDDNGHGTHCSGSITAAGEMSDGQFRRMDPEVDLTVYSAGLTLVIVKPVAGYDHMLARQRDGAIDVEVVSNS